MKRCIIGELYCLFVIVHNKVRPKNKIWVSMEWLGRHIDGH
jgi:hypothetical protein